MTKKTYGIALIVVGVLIVAFVFLAAPLHLASPGLGWKQAAGLLLGLLALAAGVMLFLGKKAK